MISLNGKIKTLKMAKRFTDTNKYKKPFIRGLQGPYKLLWDYLYHDCDHAGIWIVDFDIAQIYIGKDMPIDRESAIRFFNNGEIRIVEIEKNKWFIPSFIEFQYGELNEKNRAHSSVLNILNKNNLIDNKGHIRGLQARKDKDMVKDKDKDKDKSEILILPSLDEFLKYGKELTKEAYYRLEPAIKLKYESWAVNGWQTGGKSPRKIKNWKNTLANTIPHLKPTDETKPKTIREAIQLRNEQY